MDRVLNGKTALVTGGARGIGFGIAKRLARSGALVAVNYARNRHAAQEAVAKIESEGGSAFPIQAEIGQPGAIETLVATLNAEFSRRAGGAGLDILINNIGGGDLGTIETTSVEQFDHTFANNVRGPFFLTQALLPQLRDGGRVINISSAAARRANPDTICYAMSKAAIELFTRALAQSLGSRRIAVNSVAPGFVETEMSAAFLTDPDRVKQIQDMTAFARLGQSATSLI